MKINEIISIIIDKLKDTSTEPYREAKIIIENILNIDSNDFILNKDINYKRIEKVLNRIIEKRIKKIPLQYIFNNVFFYKYNFYIDKRVLIPRPETELLIENIIDLYNKNYKNKEINIAELGSGSGCISISLAKEIDNCIIYATDISEEALEVSKINSELLNIEKNKINFIEGDKLSPLEDLNIKFDFIISNPPYISIEDYNRLEEELYNEPIIALTDNNDGFNFYRYLAEISEYLLSKNGILACEFAYNQKDNIIKILNKNGFNNINIIKDYSNIDRIFIAKK